jgi:hypothetical protein
MAASGEPYSVAARRLAGFGTAGGSTAAKVAACARATLDQPGARMGIRLVTELPWVETAETPREQRRGGASGLPRRLLGALLREGTHVAGAGFAEPAARRYMIDGGKTGGFVCRAGAVDHGRHGWRVPPVRRESDQVEVMHWLWPLWALTGAAARDSGAGRLDRWAARPAGAPQAGTGRSSASRVRGPRIDGRGRAVGFRYLGGSPGLVAFSLGPVRTAAWGGRPGLTPRRAGRRAARHSASLLSGRAFHIFPEGRSA